MDKFTINITTLKTDFRLEINAFISPEELKLKGVEETTENVLNEDAIRMYYQLLAVFGTLIKKEDDETTALSICPIMQMTEDIIVKYNLFFDEYKEKYMRLNAFKKKLDDIKIGEYFFIDNQKLHEPMDIMFIHNLLKVHTEEVNDEKRMKLFEKLEQDCKNAFGHIVEQYEVSAFDTSLRRFTGEHKKEQRICRFCNNEDEDGNQKLVTFDKKAHAVPEALGNKGLVANEECDECNKKFGQTIEKDLISYLDVFRTFYGVSGKNGVPTLKYDKGSTIVKHIKKGDVKAFETKDLPLGANDLITISTHNINFDEETNVLKMELKSSEDISTVNIYKALCKIAIGVINHKELPYLKETIKWITSNNETMQKLPKVASVVNHHMFADVPNITLYVRKGTNSRLPHVVGEFKFKCFIYVFILPFSQKDKNDFITTEDYEYFWKFFKHYSQIKQWSFHDFSSIKSMPFVFNLKFEPHAMQGVE